MRRHKVRLGKFEPETHARNEEFLFIKVAKCQDTEKTVILGNVYRSLMCIVRYRSALSKRDTFKTSIQSSLETLILIKA